MKTIFSPLAQTFITIVEHGSITSAAEHLGLAKSAVSQHLKRLENELAVSLAVRTTRTFRLTPAGERYYERIKEIVSLTKRARTEMEAFGANPSGPITLTAPHAMMAPIITPALKSVLKQYPGLTPNVIAEDKRLDLTQMGIDIAITVGHLPDSTLKARKVGVMEDILCAHSDLAQTFVPTAPQDCAYIAHTREPKNQLTLTMQHYDSDERLELDFRPSFVVNTIEALRALTLQGLGIARLPDFCVADDLEEGSLQRVCPDHSLGLTPIYAVHVYDRHPPKSIGAIIDAVKEQLSQI